MKVIVIISAVAEWEGVKPLFPNANIENFPYGEFFTPVSVNCPLRFSMLAGERPRPPERFNIL